jgi:hypothetical protein
MPGASRFWVPMRKFLPPAPRKQPAALCARVGDAGSAAEHSRGVSQCSSDGSPAGGREATGFGSATAGSVQICPSRTARIASDMWEAAVSFLTNPRARAQCRGRVLRPIAGEHDNLCSCSPGRGHSGSLLISGDV